MDLESDPQALAEAVKHADRLPGCADQKRPQASGKPQQRRRLALDHLQVLVHGHIQPRLKAHVQELPRRQGHARIVESTRRRQQACGGHIMFR